MPPVLTRGDSLREYLTGASSDGGAQADPALSLGGKRSSSLSVVHGITINNAIPNVTVDYASGGNPPGTGILTAVDVNNLTWMPFGDSSPGGPAFFNGAGLSGIVEANGSPGQFIRVTATTPFNVGASQVTLAYLYNNVFGMSDVNATQATTGESAYRATMVRNEANNRITGYQRWIDTLATPGSSAVAWLSGSGAGSIVGTGFTDWPTAGWVQVRSSVGVLKEVIYYTAKTNTVLTVPAAGRGLLGTAATGGAAADILYPVPGIAVALDPAGAQTFGSSIQTVADEFTAPAGVTWNLGITPGGGLQIGNLDNGYQIGMWIWRHIPAGAVSSPGSLIKVDQTYNAY